jgi:c-di-GMP-binding flagellar brake protein YcgR
MENRREKRILLALPVQLSLIQEDGSTIREKEAKLRDLSKGGCAILHEREIPIGSRVALQITLDEEHAAKFGKQQLSARGAICRIQKQNSEFLLSIRFFK